MKISKKNVNVYHPIVIELEKIEDAQALKFMMDIFMSSDYSKTHYRDRASYIFRTLDNMGV